MTLPPAAKSTHQLGPAIGQPKMKSDFCLPLIAKNYVESVAKRATEAGQTKDPAAMRLYGHKL